jgi:predicted nucleic acid-binding protein
LKVSNTGPLIVLHETSLLWILKELYEEIMIPKAVYDELMKKSEGQKIIDENWIQVTEVEESDMLKFLTNLLDKGEAETIILAKEKELPILIDEKKGRKVAKSLDLKIQGTLGSFVKAKKYGLIQSVKDCIFNVLTAGYYLNEGLINEILKISGEK